TIAGITTTEFASENRLTDTTLNLNHLRTTLRLTLELEDEPRIRLRLHIQMKLSRRRLFPRSFSDRYPSVMEHALLRLRTGQIQRHGDFRQETTGMHAASSAGSSRVDEDLKAWL